MRKGGSVMEKQNLSDLNGYLFEQLERLNNDELSSDELSDEIERSKAISGIASNVINNASLVLKASETFDKRKLVDTTTEKPKMLE